MKVAICDDNKAFCEAFYHMLKEQFAIRDWVLDCEVYSSGQALLNADLTDVQVIFLDIDMPEINGLETALRLREQYRELIIVFVTAFPEFAVEGYCAEALRYVLKEYLSEQLPSCIKAIDEKLSSGRRYIKIQTPNKLLVVRLKDILYFEGTSHHRVLLHTRTDATAECSGQLGEYEEQLKDQDFLRLQKSYLVNMWHIEKICNYTATISNGDVLRVSRHDYGEICKRFVMWKGKQL